MKKCEMRIYGLLGPDGTFAIPAQAESAAVRCAGDVVGRFAHDIAGLSRRRRFRRRRRGGAPLSCAVTLLPGRARIRPLTITRSFAARPSLITRKPAVELAERHVFLADHAAVIDHQHVFARLLGADGGIGNKQRGVRRRTGHANAAEHAWGENVRPGLSKMARPRIVPEDLSMTLSTKSILPV